MSDIEQRVKKIVSEQLGVAEVHENLDFIDDLGGGIIGCSGVDYGNRGRIFY